MLDMSIYVAHLNVKTDNDMHNPQFPDLPLIYKSFNIHPTAQKDYLVIMKDVVQREKTPSENWSFSPRILTNDSALPLGHWATSLIYGPVCFLQGLIKLCSLGGLRMDRSAINSSNYSDFFFREMTALLKVILDTV